MNSVVQFLKNSTGINVNKFDDVFLRNCIRKRMKEVSVTSVTEYLSYLSLHSVENTLLSDAFIVSFSEFFRHPLTFEILEEIVIPEIARELSNKGQKEIRLWSMACASGEEAYSLAMVMKECPNCLAEQIRFRIFATDYAECEINKAKEGCYTDAALKNVSHNRVENWFTKQGHTYAIDKELKKHIDFSVFDLLDQNSSCPEESIYGDFDIVFCANILFYYKPHYRKKIIEKACSCLRKDGFIVTSATERNIFLNQNFVEVFPHSAIFKKKQ